MPDISVRTAWEVLLPAGTVLLAGEAGLDRSVTWPVVLRTHPPAFDPLRGGELAIVPLDRLHLLDSSLTLARVITQLSRMRIGAVCAIGPVNEDAVAASTTIVTAFYWDMLGRLMEHDRRTGGELVRTLDAYLSVGCSPTAAAERLHLHRNGLLYRLQRIREIVPVNLDDPERRLALHLALRIGEVVESTTAVQIQRIA